jgi:hypothetical protein
MKYIATTRDEDGTREIFLFPNEVPHNVMAEAIYGLRNQTHGEWRRIRRTPVSAGFVTADDTGPYCYGQSESMHLRSQDGDTELLRETLRWHG